MVVGPEWPITIGVEERRRGGKGKSKSDRFQ